LDWEEEMKKFLTFLLAGLLIVAMTAPVFAWEFSMKGEYEIRLRYFGRLGSHDLFGYAPTQEGYITDTLGTGQGTAAAPDWVGFAGPSIYGRGAVASATADQGGVTITRGGFSRFGSDAFYSDSRLTFYPSIRVNPAITIHGVYTVGGFRNKYNLPGGFSVSPFERYYMSQSSMNAYDTAAIGSWEQFRATIQTPMAIFSVGVKDFPFGVGATYANNTRSETFLTVVPYGPFRMLHGWWLARGAAESYATVPDGDIKHSFFQGMLFTYDAGDLSAGAGVIYRTTHLKRGASFTGALAGTWPQAGTGAALLPWTLAVPAATLPASNGSDIELIQPAAFMKYFNGRFFLNAEYAWFNVNIHRLGAFPGGAGAAPANAVNAAPTYQEGYHAVVETGAVCGPTKLSLVYALASGRDLASGNITKVYAPMQINYQFMEPYEFLMFNTYGGGNDSPWTAPGLAFTVDEHGQMADAFAYAARLDYAVAANLNVWFSGIWAHRLEKNGFLKGGKNSGGAASTPLQRFAHVATWYGGVSGEFGGPINPFVDDGFIGWEANAGVDWKLLEGLTFSTRYSYWQPGEWFNQAYMAVTPQFGTVAVGGATLTPSVNNGLMSTRDAIHAIQGSMLINF